MTHFRTDPDYQSYLRTTEQVETLEMFLLTDALFGDGTLAEFVKDKINKALLRRFGEQFDNAQVSDGDC